MIDKDNEIINEQIERKLKQLEDAMQSFDFTHYSVDVFESLNKISRQYGLQTDVMKSIQALSNIAAKNTIYSPVGSLRQISNYMRVYDTEMAQILEQSKAFYKMLEQSTNMKCFATQLKLSNISGTLLNTYEDNEDITEEEKENIAEANSVIIDEIYNSKTESNKSDTIIVISPINDAVLKYLADNPKELYHLKPGEFEDVMTEIYRRLGYDVQRTKSTRDGGKDIIIRKPEILGDFIYYVECKRYSPDRPVGVGIVRQLAGTLGTDKVNGGIIATTSYFSQDAKKLIVDKSLEHQIKMHDYEKIQCLLKTVTK